MNRHERRAQRRLGKGSFADASKLGLAGDDAEAYNSAGMALAARGEFADAAAAFRRAIAARPDYARAYNNLGIALAECGYAMEAVSAFRSALASEPELAEACVNLGNILIVQGDAQTALAYLRDAVRLRPDHAAPHANLGRALMDLDRLDEAIACCEDALRLKPDCADALHTLAIARQFQGRLAEAEDLCLRALAVAPSGSSYLTLTQIKRFSAGDAHLAAMERLAASGQRMSIGDHIALHFALGKAYDDCGLPSQAFAQFLHGNALKRRIVAYDEAATLGVMRRVEHIFTAATMRDLSGHGIGGWTPIFILGMPRSGSTLLEQILSGHPDVHGAGERTDFGRLAGTLIFQDDAADLRPAQLRQLAESYLAGLGRVADKAERITDKMPGNFLFAGLIHLVFPDAKIIHTRRDPVDTCVSCFTQLFRSGHFYSFDLGELGRYYQGYRRLMAHWRSVIPGSVMLEVDYEALVTEPQREVGRILAHCELNWNDACLDFQRNSRIVQTASATQVRQKLHDRSIGRWRRYGDALRPLFAAWSAEAAGK